ncbi:triose-phosphate transporter family-domain-containing protein [Rhodotorula diobovata]|uniref:Triose-phosphate transporter family-domain-containing protein n=1 Tax=Rhodotorula diobovata TaxID=5288 RepID=A0A5C5FR60_9BASI|nr:triose-phosphate transporter family-domain-containing protein [Rhodotorula diobovata]
MTRTPSPNHAAKGTSGALELGGHSPGTHNLLSTRQLSSGGPPSLSQRFDTPAAWLVLYFAFNLGLTLFNKLVLQGFPFPWTLTAIQMLSGTVGTQIALQRGLFVQARLTNKENGIMLMFSGLYTINIAVSNLSLHLVSVPFHQVVRAMTPLFTIVMTAVLFRKRHSRQTYLSLVPVVAGVVFATYGDYSFTPWGFILTLIGTFLAALKTIITNRVQVGRLKLHPLDLLVRMSPLAFMQCVFFGWWSGELDRVREYAATEMTQNKAIALLMNGAIAFGLNVVSFTANKKTSALTMTSLPNVKQVLTIVLAVIIFNVVLNPTNLLGITLTLCGGAWYAKVELQEKTARAAAAASATTGPSDKR